MAQEAGRGCHGSGDAFLAVHPHSEFHELRLTKAIFTKDAADIEGYESGTSAIEFDRAESPWCLSRAHLRGLG